MIAGHASSDRGTTVKQLQVTATFPRIPSDNLGEFKRMAGEALKVTADDPGVLQYDWFFNEDESKCVVRETYADSDAVLTHLGLVGDLLGRIIEVGWRRRDRSVRRSVRRARQGHRGASTHDLLVLPRQIALAPLGWLAGFD